MTRRALGLLALAALLAGCGSPVPDDSAARRAVSSHLRNASTVPIVYSTMDVSKRLTLPPGGHVTNDGGAWAPPIGFTCTWRPSPQEDSTRITSVDHFVWVEYTGENEVVDGCVPLS